jgi:hypothetical protein
MSLLQRKCEDRLQGCVGIIPLHFEPGQDCIEAKGQNLRQASEAPSTRHQESSFSCYAALRAKPYLEDRRRRSVPAGLKHAKAYISTKANSPEAQPGFPRSNGHSRGQECAQSEASQGEVQADSGLTPSYEGAPSFNQKGAIYTRLPERQSMGKRPGCDAGCAQ